jgi:nucleoside phosphorylase
LLMGIAAGIQGKVRIGNVVLSERVVAYEPGALVRKAGKASVEQRPEIDRAPYSILQDVAAYQVVPKRLRVAFNQAGGKIPKPTKGKEAEFRDHVATSITARVSTIASGEKLLRDPSKLRSIREGIHGRAEVGEMEATGVVEACRPRNVPWLVVRGISDFGDEFKDDRFHDFAARAAAAVLVDFLAFGLDLRGREHRPQVVEMHDIVHDIAQAAKRCADIATTVPPALAERSDIVAILKDLGADRLTQTRASHKVTVASPQIGTLAVFAAANLSPTYPEVLVDENHSLGKASREASNVLDDIRNSVIPSVDVLVDTWHDDELKKFGKRLRLLTNQQIMASRLWAMFEKPVEEYCPLRRLN